jgi:hypothetical protein
VPKCTQLCCRRRVATARVCNNSSPAACASCAEEAQTCTQRWQTWRKRKWPRPDPRALVFVLRRRKRSWQLLNALSG